MRGQVFNGCLLGAFLYDVPHDSLRYAASPSPARPANAPKHATFAHSSGREPGINRRFDPVRNGDGPNMPGLADQIDDRPMVLPPLKMGNVQLRRFFAAQAAPQEDSEQR